MVKVIRCYCDYCGEPFYEWVYKKGDNVDNLDYCKVCQRIMKAESGIIPDVNPNE